MAKKMDWDKVNRKSLQRKRGIEIVSPVNDAEVPPPPKRPHPKSQAKHKRIPAPKQAGASKPNTHAAQIAALERKALAQLAKRRHLTDVYKKQVDAIDRKIIALKREMALLEQKIRR